jgi:2-iminobutanoate/2-iminopropanoate deaminase
MPKEIISTQNAPAAVGPYSQAVRVGNMVFTAGQIGMDPAQGQLVGDDAPTQAEQALKNVKAVLEAAGSSLDQVVKTTVFLKNMADYTGVNEVYARFFPQNPPARSAVEVAALPRGALVEIEALGLVD